MRGAPKSTLTEAERRARQREATFRNYARVAMPNFARGLNFNGSPRRKNARPLSARMQKLVAEYKAQQAAAKQEPTVPPSALELAWRELRASMGEISVPEVEVKLRH